MDYYHSSIKNTTFMQKEDKYKSMTSTGELTLSIHIHNVSTQEADVQELGVQIQPGYRVRPYLKNKQTV